MTNCMSTEYYISRLEYSQVDVSTEKEIFVTSVASA